MNPYEIFQNSAIKVTDGQISILLIQNQVPVKFVFENMKKLTEYKDLMCKGFCHEGYLSRKCNNSLNAKDLWRLILTIFIIINNH